MKHLIPYRLLESKKDTENIISDTLNNLPEGFYFRVKYGRGRGVNDRNIASAINEHGDIVITIAKLDEVNGKSWTTDKKEIKNNLYKRFSFGDVKSVIEDLLEKLPQYSLVQGYTGYVHNNSTLVGNDSWKDFKNSSYMKLSFELRFKGIPSFRSSKSNTENDIKDLFLDVFNFWESSINIKESGDYYKIMSAFTNMSPYKLTPMDEERRQELINSMVRAETVLESNLISVALKYRDYSKGNTQYSGHDFSIGSRSFNSINGEKNKESAIEFIKNNEIIEFTLIYKKES